MAPLVLEKCMANIRCDDDDDDDNVSDDDKRTNSAE